MRHFSHILLLAIGATVAAALNSHWLVKTILFWTAASMLIVALAYLLDRPRMLGKRDDGAQAWWGWVLLWPYYLLGWISIGGYATVSREMAASEIQLGVWLGRRMSKSKLLSIQHSWSAIIDLAAEFPRVANVGAAYLNLATLDGLPPTQRQLIEAVEFVEDHRESGPVLIHCAMGHGRSATVAAAWLLKMQIVENVEDAQRLLQTRRPAVLLKEAQVKGLKEMCRALDRCTSANETTV